MTTPEELNAILERIVKNQQTEADITVLRKWLSGGGQIVSQQGKYAVNLGQGQEIHIGDRTYYGTDAELIREIIRSLLEELKTTGQFATFKEPNQQSVDELVQQVRSRIHDDIQRLHSTMPLWGVDHWVPLGDLFMDVNILEELSSSRRSELDDLWQDFTTGIERYSGDRSLDRIGLGGKRQRVSGLEVLAKNTNLMMVGKPGSGKTTYLQRIVTECNAGNLQTHRIPTLIKLREFVEDGRKFAYSLERYFEQFWELSNTEINLIFHQGRALVLLDGLDEVTGEDGKNITKQIKQFARSYPQVQVIITCRTQSQESRFERFDYVEIADFNQAQVRLFAEHWFLAVIGDDSAGLARSQEFLNQLFLEANKPIRDLAITPILLSLTCAVFHQTGKFYSKRSKLYEEGLELLLEQWDKSREIERDEIYRDLSPERKLELLSYLAVKKFEQPQYILFEQAEIESYIAEFLGIALRDSRVVLKAIESQHGLLIERANKVWSFSHLTFQEYFVANWFCWQQDWEKLFAQIHKKEWREVFLLVFCLDNADTIAQFMKQKIDAMVTDVSYIQDFLTWVNKKSIDIYLHYKPTAIRAYYFTYFTNIVDSKSSYKFIFAIDKLLEKETKIVYILARDSHLSEHFSDNYPSNMLLIFLIASELAEDFANDYNVDLPIPSLGNIRGHILYRIFSTAYQYEFKKLKFQVSDQLLKNWDDFQNWWELNGQPFLNKIQLRTNMEENNVTKIWEFCNNQKQLLQQYYYANSLLIDCLTNSSVINIIREEIEDNLLLPIAEIEKRKLETAE